MTHMSFRCIHPLYISRGFSGQWVNRFVLSCLAMALIGGPFPNIVLHPPEQFILQIIVNLKKSDFSSLSPPAELTIVQFHHRSAAWVSSELAALQILCYLALVFSPGPFKEPIINKYQDHLVVGQLTRQKTTRSPFFIAWTSIFGMGPQLNEGRWMGGWMELVLSSTTAAAAPCLLSQSGPSIFGIWALNFWKWSLP